MQDSSRTDQDIIEENAALKHQIRELEKSAAEHQQREDDLRKSEEKHRMIIEQMVDGYFETDLAGNYTFVNDAESKIIGYSRDEMLGMNSRQYLDEKSVQKTYQVFRKIYTTGEPVKSLDVEVIRKDGTRGYNEISASLIRDGDGKPLGFRVYPGW